MSIWKDKMTILNSTYLGIRTAQKIKEPNKLSNSLTSEFFLQNRIEEIKRTQFSLIQKPIPESSK